MTLEPKMKDILEFLESYPYDRTLVMSVSRVNETIRAIKGLRAEREQKVEAMAAVIRAVDMKIEAEAERDALRAQLTEACEALEPFVVPRNAAHQGALYNHSTVFEIDGHELTVGNFRRARAVYEKIKGGGDE